MVGKSRISTPPDPKELLRVRVIRRYTVVYVPDDKGLVEARIYNRHGVLTESLPGFKTLAEAQKRVGDEDYEIPPFHVSNDLDDVMDHIVHPRHAHRS